MIKNRIIPLIFCSCLLMVPGLIACPFDTGGHYVEFQFYDYPSLLFNNSNNLYEAIPISNELVSIQSSHDSYELNMLENFGILNAPEFIKETQQMFATTDEKGIVTVSMYDAIKYNITIKLKTVYLYPVDHSYKIYFEK